MTAEPPSTAARQETFKIEFDSLVRSVVPRRGRSYEHRCGLPTFRAIVAVIDQNAEIPFVLNDLVRQAPCTWTQAAVALAFLKDRGCVVSCHGRRHVAASTFLLEDALTEWHALYHLSPREI